MSEPTHKRPASIGEKRLWQPGKKVQTVYAKLPATLLGNWSGWAWVIFDCESTPRTYPLHDLDETDEQLAKITADDLDFGEPLEAGVPGH